MISLFLTCRAGLERSSDFLRNQNSELAAQVTEKSARMKEMGQSSARSIRELGEKLERERTRATKSLQERDIASKKHLAASKERDAFKREVDHMQQKGIYLCNLLSKS